MARPYGRTVSMQGLPPMQLRQSTKVVEGRLNLGIITVIDPADIPRGAMTVSKNARCRYDKTSRRPGTTILIPSKPTSNAVLRIVQYKDGNGNMHFLRFSPGALHRKLATGWVPIGVYGGDVIATSVSTDNAGTFTAGSISVIVNGTTYAQAWGVSKDDTLTALALQVAANSGVTSAVYVSGTHTFTIVLKNNVVGTTTWNLTGVTGTMTMGVPVITTTNDPDQALSSSVNAHIQTALLFNRLMFVNGIDTVREYDPSNLVYKKLGDAPSVKFITGFYNRVVVAGYLDGRENGLSTIGWSGEFPNLNIFNPMNDVSAGVAPLMDSPSDSSDFISGIFGFNNVLLVIRQKSIWIGTKQPIASYPFNFYTAVPGVGSDCENSIVMRPGGIYFADTRTQTIWGYDIGGQLERIGQNVENQILASVTDPSTVIGTYDPTWREYTIQVGSKTWCYNELTKAWTYDDYQDT